MVKVIDVPWCDDVAAGHKFFECVKNSNRFHNQFKKLQAGDLFVILRSGDRKKVVAVAQVKGPQLERQTDREALLQHLLPERRGAILDFLGDAPSHNVVFFDAVYDCTRLGIDLDALVARVPGLRAPRVLLGPGFLSLSAVVRDALRKFLIDSDCPLRAP